MISSFWKIETPVSVAGQWWFTEEEDGNAGEDNGPEKRCERILGIGEIKVGSETK